MQHELLGGITKGQIFNAEIAAQLAESDGIGGILRLPWLPFDGPQATQGRLTLLKLVEVVGDVRDRINQHDQSGEITAQPGNVEIAALDAPGRQPQH